MLNKPFAEAVKVFVAPLPAATTVARGAVVAAKTDCFTLKPC